MILKDRKCDCWKVDFAENALFKNDALIFQGAKKSALENELHNFVNAVKGLEKPLVDAQFALKAMKIAFDIENFSRSEETRMNKNRKKLVSTLLYNFLQKKSTAPLARWKIAPYIMG